MTFEQFGALCTGPLEAAYGPMDPVAVRMYKSFLEDFAPDLLAAAVAKCIGESKWLPKIAEIRQAAIEIVRGDVQELSASEAWGHAQRAIRRIDFEVDGSLGRARALVPPMVWEAMQNVGLTLLVNSAPQFIAKTFQEAYLALLSRERKLLLATPQVRREIEANRAAAALPLPSLVGAVAGRIGCEK